MAVFHAPSSTSMDIPELFSSRVSLALVLSQNETKNEQQNISVKYDVNRKEKAVAFTGVGFFTIFLEHTGKG